MGVILSRFRKKKSTLEILESLEKDIKSIEEYGQTTEQQHKAVVGRLVLFSVALYVLTAFLFYFFFFPASLYDQLLYVIPLLLFPLIIVFVKRLVSWWYRRKISQNQDKLADIKKHKKDLLEEVMDKETYKIAREILEKFAPDQLRKSNTSPSSSALISRNNLDSSKLQNQFAPSLTQRNNLSSPPTGSSGMELRRRPQANQLVAAPVDRLARQTGSSVSSNRLSPSGGISSGAMLTSESTPVITRIPVATDNPGTTVAADAARAAGITTLTDAAGTPADDTASSPGGIISSTTFTAGTDEEADIDDSDNEAASDSPSVAEVTGGFGEKCTVEGIQKDSGVPPVLPLQLVRPIIPRERSVMDRLVEYLVGDGLNQRYALICRNCSSHNGMALKEEFEYLAFRCCYCYHWNPARKQRLQSPRLDALPSSGNTTTSSSAAGESNSDDDEELAFKSKVVVEETDVKEDKSEQHERKLSTSSSEEINIAKEAAESPSSTEAEFESLVPEPTHPIQTGGGDAQIH